MLVKTPYGGTQNMPDRLARELIRLGRVKAIEAPKPAPKTKKSAKVAEAQ